MNTIVKKTLKFTGGVCAAISIVAVGTVVASSSAVKVITEGLKAAGKAMKQTIEEMKAEENMSAEEKEIIPEEEIETATSSDFEEELTSDKN